MAIVFFKQFSVDHAFVMSIKVRLRNDVCMVSPDQLRDLMLHTPSDKPICKLKENTQICEKNGSLHYSHVFKAEKCY
jgi:hypothetical protein